MLKSWSKPKQNGIFWKVLPEKMEEELKEESSEKLDDTEESL